MSSSTDEGKRRGGSGNANDHEGRPRELTPRAVVVGLAIGLVLAAAITYLALYSGLAISAAIPAALICTGIMRVAMRRVTVLENNIAQTIASSGEALALGVAFTVPALVVTGVRHELNYWEVSIVAALGGTFGVLLMIPLRRAFVLESPELRYPESVVCARISQSGQGGWTDLAPAAIATLAGALFKALVSLVQMISQTVEGAVRLGDRVLYAGTEISLALLAVGIIIEVEVVGLVLVGAAVSWMVAIPLLADPAAVARGDLVRVAWDTWRSDVRFIGVGGLIVGGLWSIVQARHAIARAVRGAVGGLRRARRGPLGRTDSDLPAAWVAATFGLATLGTSLLMLAAVGGAGLALVSTVATVGLVIAFTAVAGHIVGFVGNSNNPVSGMAICGLLSVSLLYILLRVHADATLTTSVLLVAAFVATATATAGDTAQHLKAGAILGATPRTQQVAQLVGVLVFAFVVAPIVVLLQRTYGIGTGAPGSLQAPQAAIFANLSRAVFTFSGLPWRMLWIGAGVGAALIVADTCMRCAGSPIRLHVMPVAIGMYLPFSLSATLFLGGLVGFLLRRVTRPRGETAGEAARDSAVLLCCGLITGEAIVGVSVAVPIWLGWEVPVRVIDSPAISLAALGLMAAGVLFFALRRWGRG